MRAAPSALTVTMKRPSGFNARPTTFLRWRKVRTTLGWQAGVRCRSRWEAQGG